MKKIAILFSGEGTNLENIISKLHNKELIVVKAVTNNPNAKGIDRAKKYGIKVVVIDSKKFQKREDFDRELVKELKKEDLDLVVLAGFMRILTPLFTENIKAINIHPSLLPLFKGAKAIEQSYNSDMKVAGVTIHEVSSELDSGRILAQKCFNKDKLTLNEFEKRIHEIEYKLYPEIIIKYTRGEI